MSVKLILLSKQSVDSENIQIHELKLIVELHCDIPIPLCPLQTLRPRHPPLCSFKNREKYADYFSGQVPVSCQNVMVAKGK